MVRRSTLLMCVLSAALGVASAVYLHDYSYPYQRGLKGVRGIAACEHPPGYHSPDEHYGW